MGDLEFRLAQVADAMNEVQSRVNGLGECDRKLVTYYALSTYSVNSVQTFPLLVFKGPTGTGKSRTMRIVEWFAHRPNAFSLRGRTLPVIRDELAKCHDGTAIIEEADAAWRDSDGHFERMLSDRYDRSSAQAALKAPDIGGGKFSGFRTLNKFCFGSTVLHRRFPFADVALNGRSIFVRFRVNHTRSYEEPRRDAEEVQFGRELLANLTFELPEIPLPTGIAGRVLDTYKPVLTVAYMCEDAAFWDQAVERMELDTVQIKEAQSIEPVAIVLRGLVEQLSKNDRSLEFRKNVRIKEISQSVWENCRVGLKPHQIAECLRELGFQTKNSHGFTVVVPDAAILVRACEECGYEEASITILRRDLLKKMRSSRTG